MLKVLLIALMGGVGSIGRYGLSTLVRRLSSGSFPTATLCVNVLGCLVAGALAAYFVSRPGVREEYRLALTVGLLGGFTTFSAFGVETFDLLSKGHRTQAFLYVAASVALGIVAVWIGYRLVERLAR